MGFKRVAYEDQVDVAEARVVGTKVAQGLPGGGKGSLTMVAMRQLWREHQK